MNGGSDVKSGAEQEDLKALQSSLGADGRSARSCELAAFHAYLMRRLEVAPPLRHLYATISHRRRRYRPLTQGKASIAMLVNRIKAVFTVPTGFCATKSSSRPITVHE
ncbi:hypothetical protein BC828DRAFT_418435 [Blastocladiella britannica]|nr:hypothetical protein BC828DRAFT_418435 [Blastocladiella britannica]